MIRFWLRKSVVGLCAAGLSVVLGAAAGTAAPKDSNKAPVASTVPWSGKDLTKRHPILPGVATTLKATASDADGTVVEYQWDFGDGNGTGRQPVTDPYVISAEATYSGSVGQNVTATLTVWDNQGATGTATYLMTIMADTIEVRNNIAIDKSLWWVHKQLVRYNFNDEASKPCAYLENNEWNPGMVTDAFALQGFEEQGHLPANSAGTDPYVDDARRLLNQITSYLFVMPSQTKGDGSAAFPVLNPDANGDGLLMGTLEDHFEYEMGVVLKAIVNAGKGLDKPGFANDALNTTGDPAKSVVNFTYDQIAQNIIDFIAWAQLYDLPNDYNAWQNVCAQPDGAGGCLQWQSVFVGPSKVAGVALNPKSRGSWPYWSEGWSDPLTGQRGGWGDMAMAFWVSLGLQEAEGKKQADGVTPLFTVPAFVKEQLGSFVAAGNNVQNLANPADQNYGEVYFGPNDGVYYHNSYHLVERAAELLVVLNYLGVAIGDERATAALGFIDRNWGLHNYDMGQSHSRAAGYHFDELTQQWIYGPMPVSERYSPYLVLLDQYTNGSYRTSGPWIDNAAPGANYSFFHLYAFDGTDVVWGFEEGTWVDGAWVPTKTGDDINIFALYAVSRALNGYGITDFPSAGSDPEGLGWEQRITKLLATNQLPDGGYNEYNWVYGSPFGTPWALMTMMERDVVATSNTMSVASVAFSVSTTKNGTESLVTTVKVVDAVGAPVIGASVDGTLTTTATLLAETKVTDTAGEATFIYAQNKMPLEAGTYTFTVHSVVKTDMAAIGLPVSATFTK